MATKFIDVKANVDINDVPAPTATSTVTNKVRVAWDTTISRNDLHRTLINIADAILDGNKFPGGLANGFTGE